MYKTLDAFIKTTLKRILPENLFNDFRKYYIGYKFKKGGYEKDEKEMSILEYLVKPGNIALDIGANIGAYTRILSKCVGQNGSVHAFEPVPLTYGLLTFNLKREFYKNVITYNVAVGDKLGLCRIVLPDIGMEDIYRAKLKKDNLSGKEYIVPMVTLDSLYQYYFNKVDFIKCDVEGVEQLVFKGAEKILSQNKPKSICEISSAGVEVFTMFMDYGYQSFFYDGRKLISCEKIDKRNKNSNYIFFHNEDNDIEQIKLAIDSGSIIQEIKI